MIENNNIIFPGLMVIPNFLDNYEKIMKDVYELSNNPISTAPWQPAKIQNKQNGEDLDISYRNSDCLGLGPGYLINKDPFYQIMGKLASYFNVQIKKGVDMYTKQYPQEGYMNEPGKNNTLLRYRSGQKFNFHNDWGPLNNRLISYLIYLNDDYSGGEIDFKNIGIKFKPKANSMVIFPSNFLFSHEALPIESGEKFALVNWITYKQEIEIRSLI
jgi:hypothetical protein